MLKKEIIILDCPEIKCHLVFLFVLKELCGYFVRNGYIVKVVNNINELHDNCVVFMGNDIKNSRNNYSMIINLLNLHAPNAIYIGWYWDKINASELKYFVHTYENVLNINHDPKRVYSFIKLTKSKVNTPLLLRANEEPLLIGTYERHIKYDYCYMGWNYCSYMKPGNNFTGYYLSTCNHKDFIDYDARKKIYLSSIFALGFQSDGNIGYKHVSQRIFEGLAYGCIVLSNSLPACEQTNNIVVYVSSKKDLEEKMIYYKNNPDKILQKQLEGYEWSKKFGTNDFSIQKFREVIKKNYNMKVYFIYKMKECELYVTGGHSIIVEKQRQDMVMSKGVKISKIMKIII
jgi:hypothetical protein